MKLISPLTRPDKLGVPANRFSNKIGSEAFWPTSLDKESDKAARILKTFCSGPMVSVYIIVLLLSIIDGFWIYLQKFEL